MTRKDYELIASAIAAARASMRFATDDEQTTKSTFDVLTYELVNRMRNTNPNFDEAKFRAASN